MAFPYQPTEQDEVLLKTYSDNAKMRGMDGVPDPHLAGLQAVARAVAEQSRADAANAAAKLGALPADALLQVADHAAVLVALVQSAVNAGAIRTEAKLVIAGLDAALLRAGYTEKNAFVGWRELPQRRLIVDVEDKALPVHPAPAY
jgi:hypothetical protein